MKPGLMLSTSVAVAMALLGPVAANAQPVAAAKVVSWEAEYVADVNAMAEAPVQGMRFTGYASLAADVSLERAVGWQGAHLFLHGIASMGGRPNDLAGTLQGIDNIEVSDNRAKLYEIYIEQQLAGPAATLRLGFSDLNSEFYATDSSGLLIAPAFGVGSELAATGPNGPSIFPSTALMARLQYQAESGAYAQAAVVNAEAGVIGDSKVMRPLFGKGVLVIGEIGTMRRGKLAFGAWAYSHKQEDLRWQLPDGTPKPRQAYGVYALVDQPVMGSAERGVSLFARLGISDGMTSPYSGSWQIGLLAKGLVNSRPDSQLSFGVHQAYITERYRQNGADQGLSVQSQETGVELTLVDKPLPWLTVQPDVQYVWNAHRSASASHALVLGLRLRVSAAGE